MPLVVCCFSFVGFQHSSSGPPSPSACAHLSPLLSPRSLLTPFQPLVPPSFLVLLRVLLPILVPPSSSPSSFPRLPLPVVLSPSSQLGFVERYRGDFITTFHFHKQGNSEFMLGASISEDMKGGYERKYYIKGLYVVILLVVYHAHWMSLDWVIDWVYRLRMFETPRTET